MKYFVLFFSILSYSQVSRIPIKDTLPPADDLVFEDARVNSSEAKNLKDKVSLDTLDPEENSIWKNEFNSLEKFNDNLDVKNGDVFTFSSHLKSNNIARFNAINNNGEVKTFYLDKYLHTSILRRNLLRKIGYIVPAIQPIKTITLNFDNNKQVQDFMLRISADTGGGSRRWIVNEFDNEDTSITQLVLRDLAAIDLSHKNLYNLAMGVPTKTLSSRTLRSVVFLYALLEYRESANKFHWHAGRVVSQKLELMHFLDSHNFSTTDLYDIKWIAKRIQKLSRKDFMEIVSETALPKSVQVMLYNKLLSRTYHLLDLLKLNPSKEKYKFNENPHFPPDLIKGKLKKKNWREDGFATDFSGNIEKGPFAETGRYLLSLAQSFSLSNIVGLFNKQLRVFNPNDARIRLAEKQFKEGLDHYVKTGEFLQFPVSTWKSPLLDGSLILSRDVVVGNYLGTNNMVQLADTFGFAVKPGFILGFENIPSFSGTALNLNVTYVKTYTHLKPLKSLKAVFKENYKNIIVPWLKKDLTKAIELLQKKDDMPEEEQEEFIQKTFLKISKYLGDSESLLITEKLTPGVNASTVIPLANTGASIKLGLGAKDVGIKRTQIFRKDSKTIQVFEDLGNGFGHTITVELKYLVPIIRFQKERFKGDYSIKSHELNIEADTRKNPNFYKNFLALHSFLKTGSTELLEEASPAIKVSSNFSDIYKRFSFLFWKSRKTNAATDYRIKTPSGLTGEYFSHHYVHNKGFNYESFVKEVVNFGLSEVSDNLAWANNIWQDPNDTIFGKAKTQDIIYEAQVKNNKIKKEFLSFGVSYKGWSKNKKKLKKVIKKINKDFDFNLFKDVLVTDIKKLNMYALSANMYIYDEGIDKLKALSNDVFIKMAYSKEKEKLKKCADRMKMNVLSSGEKIPTCGYLKGLIKQKRICDENKTNLSESKKCWPKFFKLLSKDLGAEVLTKFIPKDLFYLEGSINGFRSKSEVLNDSVYSNTLGKKHNKYPYGILNTIQRRIGLNPGELQGHWLRVRP